MNAIVIDEYILPTLIRYRERYCWRWSICARIINLYYETQYTQEDLKELYRKGVKP